MGRRLRGTLRAVDTTHIESDLTRILYTNDDIQRRLAEIAAEVDADYAGKDPILLGVLNGAIMVMADFSRALSCHCEMDWMAVSSYGSGTQSSGVVRILKDLSLDIKDRHVLVVEDIIDTGLTLAYLIQNLNSRGPASLEVMTMFRKPEAFKCPVVPRYVGFDLPDEFVVGYGLDYAGQFRNLNALATLAPHVYK